MTKWQKEKAKREAYIFNLYEDSRKRVFGHIDSKHDLGTLSRFLYGTSKRYNFLIRSTLFCFLHGSYTLSEFIEAIRLEKEAFLRYPKFTVYTWAYLEDLLGHIM